MPDSSNLASGGPGLRLLNVSQSAAQKDQAIIEPLDPRRLERAKRSYATRRIVMADAKHLLRGACRPRAGDLVLARIVKLGQHGKLESPEGRRATLHEGDEALLCYGGRYATDQYEAVVPDRLEPCHLVAAGGIAAKCLKRHDAVRQATRIQPLGLVTDEKGRVLNLSGYALPDAAPANAPGYRLAVVGTAMNAGKTTAAACLIYGLRLKGLRIAAAKVTGTGAGGDRWALQDAGAEEVLDFTDFGHPSTYKLQPAEIASLYRRMSNRLAASQPDLQVLEIADGLLFPETFDLLQSDSFLSAVDGLLVAAGDPMGAVAATRLLRDLPVPLLGVAGKVTASPLGLREARRAIDEPLFTLAQLKGGELLRHLPRLAAAAVA